MDYLDLSKIKGSYQITRSNSYIVFYGPRLWISTVSMQYVAYRKDITNIWKVAFLPDDKLLVDSDRSGYQLIDLRDGSTICSFRQNHYETKSRKFAVSSDGNWVYDYYDWRMRIHVVKIHLTDFTATVYTVADSSASTHDIICDENDVPCLLQAQYTNIASKQFSENGVLLQYQDGITPPGNTFYWKQKWRFTEKRIAMRFFDSADTVINNDLSVYNTTSGESYTLVDNASAYGIPDTQFYSCELEYSRKYVFLVYSNCTYVISLQSNTVILRCPGQYSCGCIIGNELLFPSKEGIQRIPLPAPEGHGIGDGLKPLKKREF